MAIDSNNLVSRCNIPLRMIETNAHHCLHILFPYKPTDSGFQYFPFHFINTLSLSLSIPLFVTDLKEKMFPSDYTLDKSLVA